MFDNDAFSFVSPTALPCSSGRLATGSGRRILIVDDEPLIVDHLSRVLGDRFDCQFASCGEDALGLIRSGLKFSVVLSDLCMPGMDGVELLGKIQVEQPEIVRILITGAGDVQTAVRGLHEGAVFRFLQKPCSTDDVVQALESGILRHRRKATYRIDRERAHFAMQASEGFTALLEERLDQAQYSTVFALAKLSEERDNCTGKHLERVSAFCRELSIGLVETGHFVDQIDDRFIRDIERSAPLHDIGKVGIPDSILLKPGKLTAKEWDVMRMHPQIGAETIAAIMNANPSASFLRMGYDVALSHHEMWDGSGYGQGLAGEDIPLAARILQVADCYDALTTWRPYKKPWTHADAIGHIVQGGGTEFDPIVAATLRRIGSPIDALRVALADEVRAAS